MADIKNLGIFDLIHASYAAQATHALIHHDVPDLLLQKSAPLDSLAAQCNIDPEKLKLLMDLGVSMGFFSCSEGVYFLKKKGIRLTRAIGSWERGYLITWAQALQPAMAQTNTWLSTDTNAYETAHGMQAWDHYRANRSLGSAYEEFQDRISHLAHIPALVAGIVLKPGERFLDVAGGKGALTLALAASNPDVQGTVLDQSYLKPAFEQQLAKSPDALVKRACFMAGDMLQSIPSGFDTYLIKHALHDWDDAKAGAIIKNIATAMQPPARLLIIEAIKRPQHSHHVLMQTRAYEQSVWSVGKVRTQEDFVHLLEQAGLVLRSVQDTAIFDLSILECSRP